MRVISSQRAWLPVGGRGSLWWWRSETLTTWLVGPGSARRWPAPPGFEYGRMRFPKCPGGPGIGGGEASTLWTSPARTRRSAVAVKRPGKLRWSVRFPARANRAWDLYRVGAAYVISRELTVPRSVVEDMVHAAGSTQPDHRKARIATRAWRNGSGSRRCRQRSTR